MPTVEDARMYQYACAILIRDGKILLGRRAQHRRAYPNCWDVVGGKVNSGETLNAALLRELTEELGITPIEFVNVGSLRDANALARGNAVYHIFAVRRWSGGEPTIRNHEHSQLQWFDIETACTLPDLALPDYPPIFRRLGTLPS